MGGLVIDMWHSKNTQLYKSVQEISFIEEGVLIKNQSNEYKSSFDSAMLKYSSQEKIV